MVDFKIIDYDNCITNVTSSIQKYYNLTPNYKTNPVLDNILKEKEYQNVFILIFDAMGMNVLKKNMKPDSYLFKHLVSTYKSTYPPTTANCTTAYVTCLNPIESGWLGWSSYFKDENITVDNFTNNESKTKEYIGRDIVNEKLPLTFLGNKIHEKNNDVKSYYIGPKFFEDGSKNLRKHKDRIIELANDSEKKFVYAYWPEPDHYMHHHGYSNLGVKLILRRIEKYLKIIERKTKNSLFIVSADHGMINVLPKQLYLKEDLCSLLTAYPSCDGRTPFFFIKDGKQEEFKKLFNEYYGDCFELISKQEAIDNHLFGYGKENDRFKDLLGDFIGISKANYYFEFTKQKHMKGHHAGLSIEEMEIPMIIIKN